MYCVIMWARVMVSCIGECVEFDVFVRLECVDNLVDRIIVSGNLESFYMLVRTCR